MWRKRDKWCWNSVQNIYHIESHVVSERMSDPGTGLYRLSMFAREQCLTGFQSMDIMWAQCQWIDSMLQSWHIIFQLVSTSTIHDIYQMALKRPKLGLSLHDRIYISYVDFSVSFHKKAIKVISEIKTTLAWKMWKLNYYKSSLGMKKLFMLLNDNYCTIYDIFHCILFQQMTSLDIHL